MEASILSDTASPPVFSPFAVAGMIVVGLACFVGFAVLLAFSRGPHEGDGGAHALSRSATGFAGLVQLLRDTGVPVSVSRAPLTAEPDGTLRVFTPPVAAHAAPPTPAADGAMTLIVLPKWRTHPMEEHSGWVQRDWPLSERDVLSVLPGRWGRAHLQRRVDTAAPVLTAAASFAVRPAPNPIDRLQTIVQPQWRPMLSDAAGGIVLGQVAPGGPYVLSDPDLLNDLAMGDAGGARTAADIITALAAGRTVTFDVSLNGLGRSRDPLRLIMEPPLLGATLCAVAAALLIGLLSARRFGPVREAARAFDLGKRGLADNAAALIARARREPNMAGPYAKLTRMRAAQSLSASRLSPAELDDLLDRAAVNRTLPDRFTALLAAAEAVRNRAALLRLARRLYHWRMELVHGRQ